MGIRYHWFYKFSVFLRFATYMDKVDSFEERNRLRALNNSEYASDPT